MTRTTVQSVKISEESLLDEIAKQNLVIFLILIGLSLFWTSLAVTMGIVVGGLISIGAFRWLHRSVKKMISNPSRRTGLRLQWSYFFRLIAIGLALYLAIAILKVSPVALSIGLSVVVLSIFIALLRSF